MSNSNEFLSFFNSNVNSLKKRSIEVKKKLNLSNNIFNLFLEHTRVDV